ncbi:2Fe-2S iron-sulfur cluster-binding protein [Paracraurococcus ruber]|uniref:Phenylacetic acid degradation protein n=1 Tax=Paracraurococcus ruber TaxID=77675 RepID=A0ABS1CXD4_9PROT|nr:2Fe-2S iron-sulfur cluster-binding protein [Paracraurococcus ruber]MBK1659189.1 phenylacetic acid degradation protein [Paracraurococcus ruber]TDG32832.1 2Fe-2S iron-sulfur cluster binding domain-containing protein [Paracraurococcus ruber]
MNAIPARARFHALTVAAVRRETADAVAVTLAVPPELREAFRFTPGQYLTLRREIGGEEVRRSYSICAGLDEDALRVGIKRVAGGAFSTWAVDSLRPGDSIEAMPPEGRFGLQPAAAGPPRTVLGIACGSGITPVLSIARSLLAAEPRSRVVLLFGNRSAGDIMFREALEDLKDRHLSRLTLVHVLSRERHELAALHGRLDRDRIAALLPGLLRPGEVDAAFLCGPAGLAEDATGSLLAFGVAPERIHVERFTPAGGAPKPRRDAAAAPAAEAPPAAMLAVTAEGVTRSIPMLPGETVLEAGLRAGLDLPWSCRGGMCCTCRAKVTEGTVAMEVNYSLQPWETQAGFVLTCQSRPTTAALAVDYDAA